MNLSPEVLPAALKMITLLGAFIVFMAILVYFTKKISKSRIEGTTSELINILENKQIGIKKSVSIIQVPGKLLVLGLTNERINVLSEITDQEIIDRIFTDKNIQMNTFSKHLKNWKTKLNEIKGNK